MSDPHAEQVRKSAAFWDRIAPKYAKFKMADAAAYEQTLARTRSYLAADHRALELGCGTGTTAIALAPSVAEIRATDVAPGMIAIAQTRAATAGVTNLTLEAVSVSEALKAAAMPANQVDVILGFNVLHLLPDLDAALRDIAEALPPGGLFISKTRCLADRSQGVLRFVLPVILPVMQLFGKAPDVHLMTEAHLEARLRAAGFDIVEAINAPAPARYLVARKT